MTISIQYKFVMLLSPNFSSRIFHKGEYIRTESVFLPLYTPGLHNLVWQLKLVCLSWNAWHFHIFEGWGTQIVKLNLATLIIPIFSSSHYIMHKILRLMLLFSHQQPEGWIETNFQITWSFSSQSENIRCLFGG